MNKSVCKTQCRDAYGRYADRDHLIQSLQRQTVKQHEINVMLAEQLRLQCNFLDEIPGVIREVVNGIGAIQAETVERIFDHLGKIK